ncbi:MAG TPA: hypothetical protein VJ110_03675 [Candidatus Nanoarchaeia archaeon]|nr:hypothetical protein [Candidatus Nanoarchaeia archaeon]
MSWAFYLKAYDVALAATEGVQTAKAHVLGEIYKESGRRPLEDEKKRIDLLCDLGDLLRKEFGRIPLMAIETYKTTDAKGLEYMTCEHFGIGGRPNALLLLRDKHHESSILTLLQLRPYTEVRDIDIMQAVGLNLILRCRKGVVNKFTFDHPKPEDIAVNRNVYFMAGAFLDKHTITRQEEAKFKRYNNELRRAVSLK